ncbi:MAG TPA: DUF1622 domain-containing protein [Phenylobacterium sp.]
MEAIFKDIAEVVARACELLSVAFVALGAGEAALRSVWHWRAYPEPGLKKEIWLRFAASILLSLEFALAADIARTAIAPNWQDIGQLAAIAAIRTVLNYFLGKDLREAEELESRTTKPVTSPDDQL